MRIVTFGRDAGHQVDRFGSDFVLAPLMGPTDTARTVCLHLTPGGRVGEHEAVGTQLFCVVAGSGWVSGADGLRVPISPFRAAHWTAGERHAAGTDAGMVAVVVEGDFTVAAPAPDPAPAAAAGGWVGYRADQHGRPDATGNDHLSEAQRDALTAQAEARAAQRGRHQATVVVEVYENGEAVPQVRFPGPSDLDPRDRDRIRVVVAQAAAALRDWR